MVDLKGISFLRTTREKRGDGEELRLVSALAMQAWLS
jgi:hypothetical protein